MSLIDPTAQIASTARIDEGAKVGPGAIIGPDCHLMSYGIIGAYTELGAGCVVHPFAVIGGPAQCRRTPSDAPHRLICGPNSVFREGVTINRGTEHGGGITQIGARALLMAQSHIGHDCLIGDDVTLANGVSIAGHVTIGDAVTIGGHAAIHQFVRIGQLAFIAANAMVSRDVPPFCMAAGDRATLRGLNVTGLRRAGLDADARARLKAAYRQLFLVTQPKMALFTLTKDPDQRVADLASFLAQTDRGCTRAQQGRTSR